MCSEASLPSLGDYSCLPIFLWNVPSPPPSSPDSLAILVRVFSMNLPEQGMVHQLEKGSVCPSAGPRTTPSRTTQDRGVGGRTRRERSPPLPRMPSPGSGLSRKEMRRRKLGNFLNYSHVHVTQIYEELPCRCWGGWGAPDRCSAASSPHGRPAHAGLAKGGAAVRGRCQLTGGGCC